MSKAKAVEEVTFELLDPSELPGRKRNKRLSLEALPAVKELKAAITSGKIRDQAAAVHIPPDRARALGITTPGRILADALRKFIASQDAKSASGQPLTVDKYKTAEGVEVVYVIEGELSARERKRRKTG